jgi:hypothetical protein
MLSEVTIKSSSDHSGYLPSYQQMSDPGYFYQMLQQYAVDPYMSPDMNMQLM